MKRLIFLLALFWSSCGHCSTFTEWYVQPTGDNLNAGSTTNDAAVLTFSGGTFVASTGVFTTAGEAPTTNGITTNMWASIYTTSGATNANFIARIIATNDTTLTVSLTAIGGAVSNVSESAGAVTCKVGGAWAGPNTNSALSAGYGHPFKITANTMTNYGGYVPRFNFRNDAQYNVTNALACAGNGPYIIQGYTTTPGDGGRWHLDGGTAYPKYTLLTISGTSIMVKDFEISNNGVVGNNDVLVCSANGIILINVIAHDSGQYGINVSASYGTVISCETYACNKGNNASRGAFNLPPGLCLNCYSHDNTGANGNGFQLNSGSILVGCVSESNGRDGYSLTIGSSTPASLIGCESWNNSSNAIETTASSVIILTLINCNFAQSGLYAITNSGTGQRLGYIANCGFTSGTTANAAGNIAASFQGLLLGTNVTYTADTLPWVDAANGNFRISSTQAKGSGYGVFPNFLVNPTTNTIGFPDIGAAQHYESPISGGEHSHVFAQ